MTNGQYLPKPEVWLLRKMLKKRKMRKKQNFNISLFWFHFDNKKIKANYLF